MTNIGTIGTITITKSLKEAIDYHHKEIGSTEWSGMLFYKKTRGNLSNLKDLKFKATGFYLMHVGTSVTTEHQYEGVDVAKAYDNVPDALELLSGNIHTHHTMKAFHSTIDVEDLKKNARNYGFYISLVVSTDEKYACKVAIPATPTALTIIDANGNKKTVRNDIEPVVLVGDLDVVLPETRVTIPEWMSERITEIQGKNKKVVTPTTGYTPKCNYRNFGGDDWEWQRAKNSDVELFAIAILTGEDLFVDSVKDAVEIFNEETADDLDDFLLMLEENVEIMHFNVYGQDTYLRTHLNDAIKVLEKQTATKKLKKLIAYLNTYGTITV